MRPSATSVCGLKLLVYAALSYCIEALSCQSPGAWCDAEAEAEAERERVSARQRERVQRQRERESVRGRERSYTTAHLRLARRHIEIRRGVVKDAQVDARLLRCCRRNAHLRRIH
jgi:hypothetical protein